MSRAWASGQAVLLLMMTGLVVVSGMAAVGSPALAQQTPAMESAADALSTGERLNSTATNASSHTSDAGWTTGRANPANTNYINTTGPTNPITVRWTFATEANSFGAGPVVVNDTVYFGTQYYGSRNNEGKLYAVDAWTGEERWTFQAPSRNQPASIAVFRDTVYVAIRQGKVHALDAATGDKFWTFRASGGLTVANRTLYVNSGSHVYALGALRGEEKWAFKTDGKPVGQPAVKDGTTYVTTNSGDVYALDAETGKKRWDVVVKDGKWLKSPSVANNTVYVGSMHLSARPSDHGYLFALNPKTGEIRWKRSKRGTGIPSPSILGNTAYYSGEYLHAVDAQTGTDRWSKRSLKGTPVLLNDIGYVRTGKTLYTLDPETGAYHARFTPPPFNNRWDRYHSPMAVFNGSLYTGVGIDEPNTRVRSDHTIFYALGTPEFNYTNLSVTPRSPEINESVTVTATVRNTGTGPGTFNATLAVNGNVTNATTARLDPRTSQTVTFAHRFPQNGAYTVEIGGLTRTITVGDVAPAPTPPDTTGSPTQTGPARETATPAGSDNTPPAAATPTATSGPVPGFGMGAWVVAVALMAVLVGSGLHKRD